VTKKTKEPQPSRAKPKASSRPAASAQAKGASPKAARKQVGVVSDPHAEREAQRYERPIPSREAILALLEERGELLTEARIAEALELDDE